MRFYKNVYLLNEKIFFNLFVNSLTFPSAEEEKNVAKYLNLFGEAFEKIKNNYVEEVSSKELIESAIEGMLSHRSTFYFPE